MIIVRKRLKLFIGFWVIFDPYNEEYMCVDV
jgi:hypothetical protein